MTNIGTWAVLGALTLTLGTAAAPEPHPAAHPDDLYIIDTRVVQVDAPAPGETRHWSVTVASAEDDVHDIYVRMSAAEGPLFAGEHPAEIAVSELGGEPVLQGPGREVVSDSHIKFASITHGSPIEIAGHLTLPRAAGNEYQGASGTLTLELAATRGDHDEGTDTGIAATGARSWWLLGTGAAAAIVAGLALAVRRTQTRRTEDIP
ncbi:hypothetical protein [Leucobacter sp. G161]|uniref:hypothetical protein n=1 Tax=Leucobacter sp. G161 TaxID=663704 RepID=UPI00073CC0C0|nr:hypothetical protein [Leucobacter sp. G161]KUF05642.1 hypothetical protein AUL38_03970 [Leucobacter sp. G161]